MVEYAQHPVLKLSPGKETWAGRKQVFRFLTPAGKLKKDVIGLRDDRLPGEPLLQNIMSRGKIVLRMPSFPKSGRNSLMNSPNSRRDTKRSRVGPRFFR